MGRGPLEGSSIEQHLVRDVTGPRTKCTLWAPKVNVAILTILVLFLSYKTLLISSIQSTDHFFFFVFILVLGGSSQQLPEKHLFDFSSLHAVHNAPCLASILQLFLRFVTLNLKHL